MKTTLLILASLLLLGTGTLSAQLDPLAGKRYGIKSAIIKKEARGMGNSSMTNTLYFDDYGEREATEMTLKMGEAEKHIRVIAEDGGRTNVTLDLDEKKAARTPTPDQPRNFRNLSQADIDRFKIRETGEETIAGRPCKKYDMELTITGVTVQIRLWIWEGIALKTETSHNGRVMLTDEAVEVEENVLVPDDKFDLPADTEVAGN